MLHCLIFSKWTSVVILANNYQILNTQIWCSHSQVTMCTVELKDRIWNRNCLLSEYRHINTDADRGLTRETDSKIRDRWMDMKIYGMSLISYSQTEITVWRFAVLRNVLIGPLEGWAIPDLYWGKKALGLNKIMIVSVVWMYHLKVTVSLKKGFKWHLQQKKTKKKPIAVPRHFQEYYCKE